MKCRSTLFLLLTVLATISNAARLTRELEAAVREIEWEGGRAHAFPCKHK
mgnify:CR=1 FL=1